MSDTRALTLTFDLLSYWHAGTGRGDGERADAVVRRSPRGLPYLPGRTVKGLLRSAAEIAVEAGLATPAELASWFGTRLVPSEAESGAGDRVDKLEAARFGTTPGVLRFSSAILGPDWEAWAASLGSARAGELAPLFPILASTAIDDTGVALRRTLRSIEVAVPMRLAATVEGPDGRWVSFLREAAPFLRSLGSGRNRGLGRVQLTVEARP